MQDFHQLDLEVEFSPKTVSIVVVVCIVVLVILVHICIVIFVTCFKGIIICLRLDQFSIVGSQIIQHRKVVHVQQVFLIIG